MNKNLIGQKARNSTKMAWRRLSSALRSGVGRQVISVQSRSNEELIEKPREILHDKL